MAAIGGGKVGRVALEPMPEPRTTTLYDLRKKRVTRNIVERIPI